ncbi:MAG: hypothetical protein FJ291_19810 [Planctomycetes bacterium]|nr:hypothetical protein [Planctomycetota bacterium]
MPKKAEVWPEGAPWPAWAAAGVRGSRVETLTEEEARVWLNWAIPLPKRVRFQAKLTLPCDAVEVRLYKGAGDLERAAAEELRSLLGHKAPARQRRGAFLILLGVCWCGPGFDRTPLPAAIHVAELPNCAQAYLITPLPEYGLAVAGIRPEGLYHGVKTLKQLLEPRVAGGKVTIPMVAVLDWPDLAERGEWGGSCARDIEAIAEHKMNLVEVHSKLALDEQGRGVATIDAARQEAARLHAVKWVPIITHLDQIHASGIYKRYPELRGKGKKAQSSWGADVVAPCFSQPKTAEVLADWLVSLAATKGVSDICVWLSEDHVQCECEGCQSKGQFALEPDACVRAWKLARQKNPDVRLRILLTQGSYATNDKVLAAVADTPEVGITYYDGGRTYDSSREPMIYPLLADFARKGRWLGCYPQLTASWRIVCPWSGPQFIKARMTEFVDKGLSCLCGYATPDNRFYEFNIAAAAEWSWNAHGRSEREFALAWATRKRLADPEKAADWAVTLGPVGWDIYGAGVPYPQFFGRVAALVRDRKPPKLGEGMFRYFPTVEHIAGDLAACDRAMELAKQLNDPALTTETQVIRGYVAMVKAINAVASAVAGKQKLEPAETQTLQAAFDDLDRACGAVTDGLKAWRAAVAPDNTAPRFADTVNVTNDTVSAIAQSLAPFGMPDGGKGRRAEKAK